jgi:hypothetical protein
MKHYDLDSLFTFGKYEGKTGRQIIDLQPSYIDWCARNLDHFYISEEVIEEIIKIKPDFTLSTEGQQKLDEKYANWECEQESFQDYDDDNDYDDRNADYNQTDWSNYNDDLDMDQQSIEFWNQF